MQTEFGSSLVLLEEDVSGSCVASGVRVNIWARSRCRAETTQHLSGGLTGMGSTKVVRDMQH